MGANWIESMYVTALHVNIKLNVENSQNPGFCTFVAVQASEQARREEYNKGLKHQPTSEQRMCSIDCCDIDKLWVRANYYEKRFLL